jgi:hypothetical protein
MLSSLHDINQYNGVTVVYLAGSSGEFFSYALSCSFPGIAQFQNKFSGETSTYSHSDRVQFIDFFGRSLLAGDACTQDHSVVISRINWYIEHAVPSNSMYLGIAHPHNDYLNFLSQFCNSWKTITITINDPVSETFCKLSRQSKLNSSWPDYYNKNLNRCNDCHNLALEWKDIILAPAKQSFAVIENFLGIQGNRKIYENLLIDYVYRNQHLIDTATKSI